MKVNFSDFGGKYNFKSEQNTNIRSYINKTRLCDTFIRAAKIDTGSCEADKKMYTPSTVKQIEFAKMLEKYLSEIGLTDIQTDKYGILTATLKGNIGEDTPVIGLISHMDTSEQAPTGPVNPVIHDYKSGDITLNDDVKIQEEDLKPYQNQTIITSDGTTLLGADDKAGIAEIMEALRVFGEHPELKRPTLRIAFTPDEEIGCGVENFDIKKFGADVAYTIDGCEPECMDTETFNAYNPEITIKGISVHTGHAYGKMVNATGIANEILNMLPENEKPETTKDKEGFFHVQSINGNESEVIIKMLVRDFDAENEKKRMEYLKNIINTVSKKHSKAEITLNENEKYHNMKEKLDEFPESVEFAKEGIRRSGLIPQETSARGGTDGCELTLRGLPTPNLGTGGVNYHSVREFVSLEAMVKCTENIINTVCVWAECAKDVMPKINVFREKS